MNRAPFQILVFPFRKSEKGNFEFAIFKRSDMVYWQGIAGGGETNETPLETAKREAYEEAKIPESMDYFPLESTCSIPVSHFSENFWPKELYVIPEYSFAVDCSGIDIILSSEHTEYHWDNFKNCTKCLTGTVTKQHSGNSIKNC
jgi:dATP pyrophosphohydrolase